MSLTILFQLTFTFNYSTFGKKFSISIKQTDPKQTGPQDVAGMSQKSGDLLICQLFLAQASYFANSNLVEMKSQIYFHLQFMVVFLYLCSNNILNFLILSLRFSNSIGDEEIQIESHFDNNDYRGIDCCFNTSLLYQIWDP